MVSFSCACQKIGIGSYPLIGKFCTSEGKMNHIKNIFIRNAAFGDEILIDDRIVKHKNKSVPEHSVEFHKLRVSFEQFADSDLERLDSAFIDVNFHKNENNTQSDFLILSRGTKIRFEIR
tara:strand:+ start:298 stop:657 length:360 start_codon:yes stop_codon:yes gene_type:complete